MGIIVKSDREIALMRQAGKIVATVLDILSEQVKPGMKIRELDIIAGREAERLGAVPSFKGYRGFPANLCVSINNEVVHGIPGERMIDEGDIVSLDFGAIFDGFQGDAAIALEAGIAAARPGGRLGDISAAIQNYAESRGYSVVREYTGHGIGRKMHEEPLIPNFGKAGTGQVLSRGMTLALEPR